MDAASRCCSDDEVACAAPAAELDGRRVERIGDSQGVHKVKIPDMPVRPLSQTCAQALSWDSIAMRPALHTLHRGTCVGSGVIGDEELVIRPAMDVEEARAAYAADTDGCGQSTSQEAETAKLDLVRETVMEAVGVMPCFVLETVEEPEVVKTGVADLLGGVCSKDQQSWWSPWDRRHLLGHLRSSEAAAGPDGASWASGPGRRAPSGP